MSDTDIELLEYAQRLIDELPKLVKQGVERGRHVPSVDAQRVADGVIAHSASLPLLQETLHKR
jgi:hypothetical protein